jgi:DNA-binding transcriptional LysR family regulator
MPKPWPPAEALKSTRSRKTKGFSTWPRSPGLISRVIGPCVVPRVRWVMARADPGRHHVDAGQALTSGSQAPSGLVRVAAPADFFDFFPMEWLNEFLVAHPLVKVDFVLSDGRADLIAERIDVALRGGILEDSGFFARKLLDAGNDALVASPAYIDVAARGRARYWPGHWWLQALADHDCLAFGHPSGRAAWRLAGPDGGETEVPVAGRFSGNTAQSLRKATLAGLGIALLPSTMTRRDLRAGSLVPVLPGYHRKGHGVHLVYPSRRHLPLAVSAFIDLVVDKLGDVEEFQIAGCRALPLKVFDR